MVTPRYCGVFAALLAIMSLGARPAIKPPKPEPIPILPAEEVWATKFEASPAANAYMDEERVYVPLRAEGLRVLARKTGEPVWENAVDINQPPLAVAGQLLLALPDEVRSVDPATGAGLWVRKLSRKLIAPLSADEERVLLFDDTGQAFAVRVSDGADVWHRDLGAIARSAPAQFAPGVIVVTLSDSRVVALDAHNGQTIWERTLPGDLSAPAAARDRVFVGSTDNFLYALDGKNGREKWKWRTGGDVTGAAAAGDRVYFVSFDNVLRAVRRDNGNQLWKAAIASRPGAPPIAFDDVVVLSGVEPRIDAFNGKTGATLGTFTAPADLQGAPAIDTTPTPFEVAMVALTRDGRLSALRPTGLMFPDPPLVPLMKLPGRELLREPRPGAVRLP